MNTVYKGTLHYYDNVHEYDIAIAFCYTYYCICIIIITCTSCMHRPVASRGAGGAVATPGHENYYRREQVNSIHNSQKINYIL